MTSSPKPGHEDSMDRYLRGDMTPAEARELAQQALNAPELFEELTYSALAKSALSTRSIPRSGIRLLPQRARWIGAGTAAAAALVVAALYSFRDSRPAVRLEPALPFTA